MSNGCVTDWEIVLGGLGELNWMVNEAALRNCRCQHSWIQIYANNPASAKYGHVTTGKQNSSQ